VKTRERFLLKVKLAGAGLLVCWLVSNFQGFANPSFRYPGYSSISKSPGIRIEFQRSGINIISSENSEFFKSILLKISNPLITRKYQDLLPAILDI
jgi:hypothetical protein